MNNQKAKDWLTITNRKKNKLPWEIKIDLAGNVFIDGEPYDENNGKYEQLHINVERHNKINTGEETQKMIASKEKATKGEEVVITNLQDPTTTETTTVKF